MSGTPDLCGLVVPWSGTAGGKAIGWPDQHGRPPIAAITSQWSLCQERVRPGSALGNVRETGPVHWCATGPD